MRGLVQGTEREWTKRPVWLLLVLMLFILAGNTVFTMTGIRSQAEEIVSLQERITDVRTGLKRPDAGERFSEAVSGVEAFKARIPDHKGLTGVLDDIFGAATRSGLKITTGDYNPMTIKETDISKYTIRFPVEGTYSQVKRFIHDFEALPHILAVEEITFSSGKGAGTIALNIIVATYFL